MYNYTLTKIYYDFEIITFSFVILADDGDSYSKDYFRYIKNELNKLREDELKYIYLCLKHDVSCEYTISEYIYYEDHDNFFETPGKEDLIKMIKAFRNFKVYYMDLEQKLADLLC